MYLDPRTIVVINIFSSALLGLALLAVSKGYLKQIRGISNWAFTSLLHSFAWILFAMRGIVPDFFLYWWLIRQYFCRWHSTIVLSAFLLVKMPILIGFSIL